MGRLNQRRTVFGWLVDPTLYPVEIPQDEVVQEQLALARFKKDEV